MKGSTRLTTIYRRWPYVLCAATVAFTLGLISTLRGADEHLGGTVRSDIFKGAVGDDQALARGLATCERLLKENPKNAEAMVWHGTGLFIKAGAAYRGGDMQQAGDLLRDGVEEMDSAVALAPESVAVRSVRGSMLIKGSMYMPTDYGRPLLEKAITDYEKIMELQAKTFDKLGEHSRGEILFGLGDAYGRDDQAEKAGEYFRKVVAEMKDTEYAKRANKWLETKTLTIQESGCIGCHVQ